MVPTSTSCKCNLFVMPFITAYAKNGQIPQCVSAVFLFRKCFLGIYETIILLTGNIQKNFKSLIGNSPLDKVVNVFFSILFLSLPKDASFYCIVVVDRHNLPCPDFFLENF